jgi:hypothetical protein
MAEKMVNNSCYSCARGNSLKGPASKAYAQVFAPHHGWAIRKAVAAGMYALPTKTQLLKKLNEDGECLDHFKHLFLNSISHMFLKGVQTIMLGGLKPVFQSTFYLTWCTIIMPVVISN